MGFLSCSDMGCHIDGFIAVVAHTHVIQAGPVTGRAADVIAAANTAAEVALRLVRPGKKVIYFYVLKQFSISLSHPLFSLSFKSVSVMIVASCLFYLRYPIYSILSNF